MNFNNINVLVLGDVMLDRFIYGNSTRLSPEAPVPIVLVNKQISTLGGAANVALNLRSLGCSSTLCGITGTESASKSVNDLLENNKIDAHIVSSSVSTTIVKNRIIADNQHVVRFDFENDFTSDRQCHDCFNKKIKETTNTKFNSVIISDYNKGTITEAVIENVKLSFPNAFILADPKPQHKSWYKDLYCITPNIHEARDMSEYSTPKDIGRDLKDKLNLSCLLITMSDQGVLFVDPENKVYHIEAYEMSMKERHHKIDVTGAGDTLISVFAASISTGNDLLYSVVLSNVAASIVVNKLGTATCSVEELEPHIKHVKEIYEKLKG